MGSLDVAHPFLSYRFGGNLSLENVPHGVFPDAVNHLLVHLMPLKLVFHYRIFLTICSKPYSLSQLIHGIYVVHPLLVYNSEHNNPFKLTHDIKTQFFFFGFIHLQSLFHQQLFQVLSLHVFYIFKL